jgi:hypothetical protein
VENDMMARRRAFLRAATAAAGSAVFGAPMLARAAAGTVVVSGAGFGGATAAR